MMTQHPDLMMQALQMHNALIRQAKWKNYGTTVEQEGGEGDGTAWHRERCITGTRRNPDLRPPGRPTPLSAQAATSVCACTEGSALNQRTVAT